MQNLKILKYTISLLILLTALPVFAQTKQWHAVSLGLDLSRIAVPFIDSTRYGWEVSGNYEFIKDVFGRVEFGSQTTRFIKPTYAYNANGAYTRIGLDYNYMKHVDPVSSDNLFIGALYGFSTFFHEADNIQLKSPIWGIIENEKIDRKWLTANWLEISTGMQTNLINNFYLAWSVRFRIMLWQQNDPSMQPFHIPGYGRAWNNSGVGINYSLYYKIPFARKKNKDIEQE
jgi:hypothetical protein